MKTPENIELRAYRWPELVFAFVVGAPLFLALTAWKRTLRFRNPDLAELPPGAILFGFHEHLYVSLMNEIFYYPGADGPAWLGYHGFLSYVGAPFYFYGRLPVFRYKKSTSPAPLDQIISYLRAHPNMRFALATDAGRPYGEVRGSLIKISRATGRPLVAFRYRCERALRIFDHLIPLPFSTVELLFSPSLPASSLPESDADARVKAESLIAALR